MRSLVKLSLSTLALALAAALPRTAGAADLLEVYELARASDPQLAAIESQRLAVGENVVQARSALLPNLSGTAQLADSDSRRIGIGETRNAQNEVIFGPRTTRGDVRTRDYRVTLRQSIYNHSNYTRLKSNKALRSRAEADYEAALDNLFTRVSTAYFNVLTAQSNVEALQAEETAVGRQLEQAEQRFEVGLTAITDVHEARARFDSSRANRILAENQLNDALEALTELTGQRIESVEAVGDDIPLVAPEPSDPNAWVDTAIDESPVLASRRFALESAEADIGTARAGHLPSLDAFANYSDSETWGIGIANGNEAPATDYSEGLTVGVLLTVPMFEGFATQSRVRQAVFNRDAAGDFLEQDRRAVERNVRNQFRAVVAGISEVEARRQALVSAQSALEATQAGFEVGTRTIVDVLISQQQLFAAQREYARARHAYIVSGLQLKQSAGVIDVEDLQAVNALLSPTESASQAPGEAAEADTTPVQDEARAPVQDMEDSDEAEEPIQDETPED